MKMMDEEIEALRRGMADAHRTAANHSLQWKQKQLTCLQRMLVENKGAILSAVTQDLGRHPVEAEMCELSVTLSEIKELLGQLPAYSKPQQLPSPGIIAPVYSEFRYEPLRSPAVLVIAPFNYPINLSLVPVAGSLAAGNPTVLKPSELCPATSSCLAKIVPKYFDKSVFAVVEGGVEETTSLLKHPWGLVFFTGSTRVGKIVSAQAAQTLTPVVLELGGKSPVYIGKNPPDLHVSADRIIWGKTLNSGQTCVAPDYVLCHKDVLDQFCEMAKKSLQRMFGTDVVNSHISRIVNESTAKRLIAAIEEIEDGDGKRGKIIFGGSKECDAKVRFVTPTIVLEPGLDSQLMTTEIFGPILPVIPVSSDEEAIEFIAKQQGKMTPLAMYVFTRSSEVFEKMAQSCRSAAIVRNDVIVQFSSPFLPIGGLGTSGSGNYKGRFSIEAFSHKRPFVYKPATKLFDYGGVRYAPYNDWNGLKGQIFLLLAKLPKIPVMHSSLVLLSAIIVLGVFAYGGDYMPFLARLRTFIIHWIADGLMALSQALRP